MSLKIYSEPSQIVIGKFSLRFALGSSQFDSVPTFLLEDFCKINSYTWRKRIELNLERKHNWTLVTYFEPHSEAQPMPVT